MNKQLQLALIVCAAGICSSALAVGEMPAPKRNYFYGQANVGYNYTPWQNTITQFSVVLNNGWTRGNSNFTVGANLGYIYHKNYGVEAGFFFVPKVTNTATPGFNSQVQITTWPVYGALVLRVPTGKIDWYTKGGLAAKFYSVTNKAYINAFRWTINNRIDPFFASGLNYNIKPSLFLNLQAATIVGNISNINTFGTTNPPTQTKLSPQMYFITGGIGFKYYT